MPRSPFRRSSVALSLLAAAGLAWMGGPARAGEAPGEALVKRAHKVAGWLLGLRLDPQEFARALTEDFRVSPPEKNAKLPGQLDELEKIMALDEGQREVVRIKVAGDLLAQAKGEAQRPLHAYLLAAHAAANPPLAPGPPALTRQSSDAFAQLWTFMFVEAVGGKHAPLAPKVKDTAAETLAAKWGRMEPAQRDRIVQSPLLLAAMRYRWRGYPEDTKAAIRASWRKQFEPALPRLMAKQAARQPAQGQPASGGTEFQKAQRVLANYQANVSLMSDMISMQADTSAHIIRNMGPHEYTYKWVYKPD